MVGTTHCGLSGNWRSNALPSALPISHSIQAEVSTTRKGAAITLITILAIAVTGLARAFRDTGQLIQLGHRHEQHALALGDEHELLPCLPMLFLSHRFGNGNLKLAGQRGGSGHFHTL